MHHSKCKNENFTIFRPERIIAVVMGMKKDMSDEELLRGIRNNDSSCFEVLFRKYYPMLTSFVTGIIKDHNRAEDISQNIFMRLWSMRFSLDDSSPIRNYLCVCARNAAIDFLRARSQVRQGSIPEDITSNENLEDKISASFTLGILQASIPDMPEQRSRIFRMSREEHLSNEEIAEHLGLSVRTVEKHIQLALKELRGRIS